MHQDCLRPKTGRKLPPLTTSEFAELGAEKFVYLKQVEMDGQSACAIFSANGHKLGLASDRNTAAGAALRVDLTPVSIH